MRSPINTQTIALKPDDGERCIWFLENNFEDLWSGLQGRDEANMAAWVTFSVSDMLCSFSISLQASASQLAAWAQGHCVTTGTSEEGLVDSSAVSGLQIVRGISSYHLRWKMLLQSPSPLSG